MDLGPTPTEIPEYGSRVADLMMALSIDRPGNPTDSSSKRPADVSLADRKIPTSVEEFMEMEGLVSLLQFTVKL